MPHDDNGQLTGTTTIRVRYVECDPMGIVHHSIYPVWLEMGRTELLRDTGYDYRQMEADGAAFAVTALNIRYRASARYDDVLTLRCRSATSPSSPTSTTARAPSPTACSRHPAPSPNARCASRLLDSMDLERERGITIKASAVTVTPHHDGEASCSTSSTRPATSTSGYEVSRALAACEGALLVVDAAQGVEAQTVANAYLAVEHDLEIIPVINKIDLPARPDRNRRSRSSRSSASPPRTAFVLGQDRRGHRRDARRHRASACPRPAQATPTRPDPRPHLRQRSTTTTAASSSTSACSTATLNGRQDPHDGQMGRTLPSPNSASTPPR
jgi:hypothetical protein